MAKKLVDNHKIHLLVLQESIWQIEEKIDRTLEALAQQEAVLLRIKSLAHQIKHKLGLKAGPNHKRRPSK